MYIKHGLDGYVSLVIKLEVGVSPDGWEQDEAYFVHTCWNPPSGSSSWPSPVPQ